MASVVVPYHSKESGGVPLLAAIGRSPPCSPTASASGCWRRVAQSGRSCSRESRAVAHHCPPAGGERMLVSVVGGIGGGRGIRADCPLVFLSGKHVRPINGEASECVSLLSWGLVSR